MILELLAGVGVVGIGVSIARLVATRLSERTLSAIELEDRATDRAIGVRDGDRLDPWVPIGTVVPTRVTHLLRGVPEEGRGLRLSLYDSAPGKPTAVSRRLVRTWLGPYEDSTTPVLVEVTLGIDRLGRLRLSAIDQKDGRRLQITRDNRNVAPETVVSTVDTLTGR